MPRSAPSPCPSPSPRSRSPSSGCVPTARRARRIRPPRDATRAATERRQPAPSPTATPTRHARSTSTATTLISPDTIYVFNPNFGLIDDFDAEGRLGGGDARSRTQGVACRWQNQTSGDNIDLSVAQLDDDSLTALKNAAVRDSARWCRPTATRRTSRQAEGSARPCVPGRYWIVATSVVLRARRRDRPHHGGARRAEVTSAFRHPRGAARSAARRERSHDQC